MFKRWSILLFGKLRIKDYRYEPCFPTKRKLISCQIQAIALFQDNNGRKRIIYDRNIHKGMRIPVNIYQTNKSVLL